MQDTEHALFIPDESLGDLVEAGDEHRCTTRWSARVLWLGIGIALGAVAAYLGDPDRGNARRAELRQRATSAATDAQEQAVDRTRDVTQRTVGSAIDAIPETEQPSDAVVLERVRAQAIGPSRTATHKLVTTVRDGGVVELRGEVDDAAARTELLTAVRDVDGVTEVVDLTHLPGEPSPTRS